MAVTIVLQLALSRDGEMGDIEGCVLSCVQGGQGMGEGGWEV